MPVTSYNDSESCTIRCTIHCRLQLIADCSSQMVRRLLTVATIAYARGGLPFVSVAVSECTFVCPCSKRKTACAINTKVVDM